MNCQLHVPRCPDDLSRHVTSLRALVLLLIPPLLARADPTGTPMEIRATNFPSTGAAEIVFGEGLQAVDSTGLLLDTKVTLLPDGSELVEFWWSTNRENGSPLADDPSSPSTVGFTLPRIGSRPLVRTDFFFTMSIDGVPQTPSNPFNLPPLTNIVHHPYGDQLEGGRDFQVIALPGAPPHGLFHDEEGGLMLNLPSGAFNGQTFYERGSIAPQQGGVPPFLGNVGALDLFGFAPVKDKVNGIYNAHVLRESELGDVEVNGVIDAGDIDLLSAEILNGHDVPAFDLTGDGEVNQRDRQFLVEDILDSQLGDTDLDGLVEFDDFLTLSEHFGQAGGWAHGDFNGNGEIDFPDFLALADNIVGQPVGTAAVPEPAGYCAIVFGLLGFIGFRRRR